MQFELMGFSHFEGDTERYKESFVQSMCSMGSRGSEKRRKELKG